MPGAAVAGPVAARDLKIEGVKSSCPSGLPSAGCHAPGRRIYRAYGGCGGVLVCFLLPRDIGAARGIDDPLVPPLNP